jgi:hypothetical protein
MSEENKERREVAVDPEAAKRRAEIIAAAKARAAAKKSGGAPTAAAPSPAGAVAARPVAAPAPAVTAYAASLNPGGAAIAAPLHPKITALGTINQGIELTFDAAEEANVKKILGGIGAYANPLRARRWQIDYRYWKTAKQRLTEVGYQVEGKDLLGRPLDDWDPLTRGWVRGELA